MKVRVLTSQSIGDVWNDFVENALFDIYNIPEYTILEAEQLNGTPSWIHGEDEHGRLLIPLIVRPVSAALIDGQANKLFDATSAYGYPGIVISNKTKYPSKLVSSFLETAESCLRDMGIVSIFVRLNPLLNDAYLLKEKGCLTTHGTTVWIDLTKSNEELSHQTRTRYRGNVNAARRDGLYVCLDEQWETIADFTSFYHQTMNAVGADKLYFFTEKYFRDLRIATDGHIHLFLVKDNERLHAAGLFSECNGMVQYLFSGKDEVRAHPHATKLLMVHVRDWAKQRGNRIMHLGGGLGATDDNLMHFKRGFSKLTKQFSTWRWIVDKNVYNRLVNSWETLTHMEADDETGYFPAYRKGFSVHDNENTHGPNVKNRD